MNCSVLKEISGNIRSSEGLYRARGPTSSPGPSALPDEWPSGASHAEDPGEEARSTGSDIACENRRIFRLFLQASSDSEALGKLRAVKWEFVIDEGGGTVTSWFVGIVLFILPVWAKSLSHIVFICFGLSKVGIRKNVKNSIKMCSVQVSRALSIRTKSILKSFNRWLTRFFRTFITHTLPLWLLQHT